MILPAGTRLKHINPADTARGEPAEFEIHSVDRPDKERIEGSNKNLLKFTSDLTNKTSKERDFLTSMYLPNVYPRTRSFKKSTSSELSALRNNLLDHDKNSIVDQEDLIKSHRALMGHDKYDFETAITHGHSQPLSVALISHDSAMKKMSKDEQIRHIDMAGPMRHNAHSNKYLHPDIFDSEVELLSRRGGYISSALESPHATPNHLIKLLKNVSAPEASTLVRSSYGFGNLIQKSNILEKAKIAEQFHKLDTDDETLSTSHGILNSYLDHDAVNSPETHAGLYEISHNPDLKQHILQNSKHIDHLVNTNPSVIEKTDNLSLNPHLNTKSQDKVLEHILKNKSGDHDLFIRSLPKSKHSELLSNPQTPQHVVDSALRSTTPEEWSSDNHSRALKLAKGGDIDLRNRIVADHSHHSKSISSSYLMGLHDNIMKTRGNLANHLYSHPSLKHEDLHKILDDFSGEHGQIKYRIAHYLASNPNLQPDHIDRITKHFNEDFDLHIKHPNSTGANIVNFLTRKRAGRIHPSSEIIVANNKLEPKHLNSLIAYGSKNNRTDIVKNALRNPNTPQEVLSSVSKDKNFHNIVSEHRNTSASTLHEISKEQSGAGATSLVRLGLPVDNTLHDIARNHHPYLKAALDSGQIDHRVKEAIIKRSSYGSNHEPLMNHPSFTSEMLHDAIDSGVDLKHLRNNPNLTTAHFDRAYNKLYSSTDILEHMPIPPNHNFGGSSSEWRSLSRNPHLTADQIEHMYDNDSGFHSIMIDHKNIGQDFKTKLLNEFKKEKYENSAVKSILEHPSTPSETLEEMSNIHRPTSNRTHSGNMVNILANHKNMNPRTLHNLIRSGSSISQTENLDRIALKAEGLKHPHKYQYTKMTADERGYK